MGVEYARASEEDVIWPKIASKCRGYIHSAFDGEHGALMARSSGQSLLRRAQIDDSKRLS